MSGSSELSRLLAAERAANPPPGASAAGLERLLGSMAAGAAPLPIAAGSLQFGLSLVSKWVGVGFLVGMAGAGAASLATPAPAMPPTHAPVVASATSKPAALAAAPPLGSEPAHLVEPTPQFAVSSARAVAAPASAPALESASPTPNLEEELRLIAGAKRELDGGRPHLALAWLSEHRQRFPKGMLALEREGLQVLGSCSGGPRPELARAFAQQYPRSPMLGQVLRRCGLAESGAVPSAAIFSESTDANGRLGEPTSR